MVEWVVGRLHRRERPGHAEPDRARTGSGRQGVDALWALLVIGVCAILGGCAFGLCLIRAQAHSHAVAAAEAEAQALAAVSVDRDVGMAALTQPIAPADRSDLEGDVADLQAVHHLLGLIVWSPGGQVLFAAGDRPRREMVPTDLHQALSRTIFTTVVDSAGHSSGAAEVLLPVVGDERSSARIVAGLLLPAAGIEDQRAWSSDILSASAVAAAIVGIGLLGLLVRRLRHQFRLARTDPLTMLGNKVRLDDEAPRLLARTGTATLVLIDLDGFKRVNDTFGHAVGDQLLVALAATMRDTLQPGEVLVRLGGDEFAALVPGGVASGGEAAGWRLLNAIRTELLVGDIALEVDASVGVAVYPDHGRDLGELLQAADIAMYHAKSTKLGLSVFSSGQRDTSAREALLVGELRSAIERGELVLHYQPIVALRPGAAPMFEALVRWQHPGLGLLAPSEFIPIAEETSVIHPLTAWVIDHAIAQCRAWHDAGWPVSVGVNLSARSLSWPDLADLVLGTLARHQVPATSLTVEVTESSIVAQPEVARGILNRLRAEGVTTSIDDFGTGFTSLSHLGVLPADVMKIDKCFTADLSRDPVAKAIVASTVALAHGLGMQVVAEGVEDAGTLALLRDYDCDMVQGFHLSRPLTAAGATGWLARRAGPSPLFDVTGHGVNAG